MPWSEWINVPGAGRRESMAMPNGIGDQRRGRGGVDGPAHDPAAVGIQDHRAVDLPFAGGVPVG